MTIPHILGWAWYCLWQLLQNFIDICESQNCCNESLVTDATKDETIPVCWVHLNWRVKPLYIRLRHDFQLRFSPKNLEMNFVLSISHPPQESFSTRRVTVSASMIWKLVSIGEFHWRLLAPIFGDVSNSGPPNHPTHLQVVVHKQVFTVMEFTDHVMNESILNQF